MSSGIEGFGDQSAENLISAIASSKSKPASRVLFGLGIFHVGQRAADLLIDHFISIDVIVDVGVERIETIHGIGSKTAESVVDFFSQLKNLKYGCPIKII